MPPLSRILILEQFVGAFDFVEEGVVVFVAGVTTEHDGVRALEVAYVVDVFGDGVPVV